MIRAKVPRRASARRPAPRSVRRTGIVTTLRPDAYLGSQLGPVPGPIFPVDETSAEVDPIADHAKMGVARAWRSFEQAGAGTRRPTMPGR